MKKIILKLDLHDGKEKQKAMKTVSALSGIDSISMDMKEKKLTVIGAVDAITITSKLRKYWPTTDIIFVGPAKEPEKPAEKKEEGKKEDGKKEDEKKEGGEEKKEGEKKEGDEAKKEGGDDKKKDEKKAPVPVPVYDPMWEMMKRGYNPQMFGYNPQMSYYNPYVANSYNPHMASYNPPQMTTHYVQSVDENPNICTIC